MRRIRVWSGRIFSFLVGLWSSFGEKMSEKLWKRSVVDMGIGWMENVVL